MALAKLRIHTESTLQLLETSTRLLGEQMRRFLDKVYAHIDTRELPREEAARVRRKMAMLAKNPTTTSEASGTSSGKMRRKLNLNTYKYHSLGDYATTIRRFGTTDSYSTQLVSNLF